MRQFASRLFIIFSIIMAVNNYQITSELEVWEINVVQRILLSTDLSVLKVWKNLIFYNNPESLFLSQLLFNETITLSYWTWK